MKKEIKRLELAGPKPLQFHRPISNRKLVSTMPIVNVFARETTMRKRPRIR